MKKLILISAMFMATSIWADYALYGNGVGGSMMLSTYSDYNSCESDKTNWDEFYTNLRCVYVEN